MKITITVDELGRALPAMARSIASKTTLPILYCVLLDARDGQIALKATDLSIHTLVRVAGRVDEPGACAVPYALFADMIAQLPGAAMLTMTLDDKRGVLHVRYGPEHKPTYSCNIKVQRADEYPEWPGRALLDGAPILECKGTPLAQAVDWALHAVAGNGSQPTLACVQLRLHHSEVIAAGLDGFRVAMATMPHDGTAYNDVLLLPSHAVLAWLHLHSKRPTDNDMVRLYVYVNHAIIESESYTLHCTLDSGRPMDVLAFAAQQPPRDDRYTVAVKDLRQALRTVLAVPPVRLAVTLDPAGVTLGSEVAEIGGASGAIDTTNHTTAATRHVLLNPAYLKQTMADVQASHVTLAPATEQGSGPLWIDQVPDTPGGIVRRACIQHLIVKDY